MNKLILAALFLIACNVPTPSHQYRCTIDSDCDSDRMCDRGYCVLGSVDAGVDATDAAAADAAIDAPPDATMTMSFAVGNNECNGSRCRGGYNGTIDMTGGARTADKVCAQHSYTRATTFTISNNQPGGAFCSWNPTTMQWGCDPSCSGCNAINNVTCSTP
jgi:hypothetical protein